MVKKIGILTSGGDAPGMNDALFGAIRAGYKLNKEMYESNYITYSTYKKTEENLLNKLNKHIKKKE